jgi:hypothetical protein
MLFKNKAQKTTTFLVVPKDLIWLRGCVTGVRPDGNMKQQIACGSWNVEAVTSRFIQVASQLDSPYISAIST